MAVNGQINSRPVLVICTSKMANGFDWDAVAEKTSRRLQIICTPGGSPCELELLQSKAPETDFTMIGLSASDLDEFFVSDFRAQLVPWARSLADLRESHADTDLVRRTLGEYPLRYTQVIFPTAGNTLKVLIAAREVARQKAGRKQDAQADAVPAFHFNGRFQTNRISDWDPGRRMRRAEEERNRGGERHWFAGPKHLALERMVKWASSRGKVFLVVMPESPFYIKEVFDQPALDAFEQSLADTAKHFPDAGWVRLDRTPKLRSDDVYYDLLHVNSNGCSIATPALLAGLEPALRTP